MRTLALALLVVCCSSEAGAQAARERYETFSSTVLAAFDSSRGGFVTKSGVPNESAVELALGRAEADARWRRTAVITLSWTRGLLDTMSGGYIRSGNTRSPEAEGLDKPADANGRRLENLILAWRLTRDETHRKDALRVVDWFDRVLLDGRGGFVAAQVGDRDLVPAANGHAIHAWLTWAALQRESRRRNFALLSLDRVWETCWTERFGLLRKNSFGDVLDEPQLADQVEMGRAFLLAALLCRRPVDRERAVTLGNLVMDRFEDRERGGFRTQSVPRKDGTIQKAPRSARLNARAALFLAELAAFTGEARYRQGAERAAESFRKDWPKLGLDAADWALAARASFAPDLPEAPDWVAEAQDKDPPRPRSVRFRVGKR